MLNADDKEKIFVKWALNFFDKNDIKPSDAIGYLLGLAVSGLLTAYAQSGGTIPDEKIKHILDGMYEDYLEGRSEVDKLLEEKND